MNSKILLLVAIGFLSMPVIFEMTKATSNLLLTLWAIFLVGSLVCSEIGSLKEKLK